ncbi:MAG: tRNA (adenosine(37)-N6)-threonylcarbamoyltransferase complex ATPase subunit type 1 TsaE, partial [Clostridia bacterium]|nr:tRNA (adenosine(37)-N6)-threonylcarbamoyltransferase complex ATPase subunit type 1 TsaE [Clostridia bacterium]
MFHFDCYRIADESQAFALGFADYFGLGGICLVEWSEKIAWLLPERLKRI